MKGGNKLYSIFQRGSALFMIGALVWLTVSTPFVFASQQALAKQTKAETSRSSNTSNEDKSSNPFSGTTEEKNPGSTSLSEEYLHEHGIQEHFFTEALQYHKGEDAGTYVAFHGELLVPPPNLA